MEKLYRHKDRISIIRDGVDLDLFKNIPKLTEVEQKNIEEIKEWKEDNKLLVYIGGLSDNKGVGELLEGFKNFTSQRGGWKLLIGGFGSDEEKYKEFIKRNDLNKWVYFAGKVKYFSLPAYLALADAAIDPKNGSTEASGKLVNLMAAGCPIICFEKEFNRARLGEKGYYMKSFGDLDGVLANINGKEKIDYNLKNVSQGKEVQKLMSIFRLLTK